MSNQFPTNFGYPPNNQFINQPPNFQPQFQNFSQYPVMGDHQQPGFTQSGGYPPPQPAKLSSGYTPNPQGGPGYGNQPPQVSPGYPPQQQPQVSPGYPPQQQPGYPPQQQPGYPPQQQPQVSPGYPGQPAGQYPAVSPPGPSNVAPAVCPTAPDISSITPIPGYEGVTFDETPLTPPTVPDWQPDEHERKPLENLPRITEEEIKDAAVQFASENCCYGKAPARDMEIKEIQMISAFHYKLETFTEKRTSCWKFEPYHGQPIDGPQNGRAPSPWEVMAVPQSYFTNSFQKIEVPHTAFTRPCHACVGNGRVRCEKCLGMGRNQCTWCKGRGRVYRFDKEENCTSCNATGYDRCFKCSGTGQVKCKICDARGNLKGFVELVVTWCNHTDDYISEVSCMPKELIREVSGQNAFEEENPRVFPIVQGAEEGVCKASSNLINKHGSSFNNERILKQRQTLRIIPIAQAKYEWNGKTDTFCVYGYEHKVYFKDYPQTCCCGCVLI